MAGEFTQTGTHTAEQWEEKWEEGKIGWHRDEVDHYLKKYLVRLTGDKATIAILVSWCGKSLDLLWLVEQGHTVVGVELSELAVQQLFQEHSIPFTTSMRDGFKVYTATDRDLRLFCGSMYDLTPSVTGCTFDAVWDMNALGANNPSDREKHIHTLHSVLKPQGRILLSNFEYDPSEHVGPPFSLPPSLIQRLFQDQFQVELLEHIDMTGTRIGTLLTTRFNLTWAKRPIHLLQRLT